MSTSVIRDRIGFKEFKLEKLPENRCQARVVLAWPDGSEFTGTAQDEDSESGRLRCAVEATVRTVERSVRGEMALRVQGGPHDRRVQCQYCCDSPFERAFGGDSASGRIVPDAGSSRTQCRAQRAEGHKPPPGECHLYKIAMSFALRHELAHPNANVTAIADSGPSASYFPIEVREEQLYRPLLAQH